MLTGFSLHRKQLFELGQLRLPDCNLFLGDDDQGVNP
ncbi:MAG: hypothetical protein N838_08720 [Thiohalocapsa sp. PB-PSB1]|nr:MAG: hypothetical protein N838_08720 [Thiohalocapsa sp. PB-PSB1]